MAQLCYCRHRGLGSGRCACYRYELASSVFAVQPWTEEEGLPEQWCKTVIDTNEGCQRHPRCHCWVLSTLKGQLFGHKKSLNNRNTKRIYWWFYVYLEYTLLLVCLIDVMVSGRTVPNIIAAWPNAYRLLLHVHILQILEHLKAKKDPDHLWFINMIYPHMQICICPRPKSSNDSWAPVSESSNFCTYKWCEAFVSKCQLWPEIIHSSAKKYGQ